VSQQTTRVKPRDRARAGPPDLGPRREKIGANTTPLKAGFFAKPIFLDGESEAEHEDLRRGVWEEEQPETQSEIEEVEHAEPAHAEKQRADGVCRRAGPPVVRALRA
jgi:hypothetical protein